MISLCLPHVGVNRVLIRAQHGRTCRESQGGSGIVPGSAVSSYEYTLCLRLGPKQTQSHHPQPWWYQPDWVSAV